MKPSRLIIAAIAVGLLAGAWWWTRDRTVRQTPKVAYDPIQNSAQPANAVQPVAIATSPSITVSEISDAPISASNLATAGSNLFTPSRPADSIATASTPATPGVPARVPKVKPPLVDPLARVALFFVGADPLAEEVWFDAVNNPDLPAKEREDLIEDLNEFGLRDPKHPTLEDLPLIWSRMALIEAAGHDAMDQVNADAFREAYKDLVNLAEVALGGGEPVK